MTCFAPLSTFLPLFFFPFFFNYYFFRIVSFSLCCVGVRGAYASDKFRKVDLAFVTF